MSNDRPPIPAELKREVLIEAGHRCAISACQHSTTEIAHIVPWREVRTHKFDNLIALCPNCHTRYDKGEIDRKSMLKYKTLLSESQMKGPLVQHGSSFISHGADEVTEYIVEVRVSRSTLTWAPCESILGEIISPTQLRFRRWTTEYREAIEIVWQLREG